MADEGLDIPISTPGAPASASALERVAVAAEKIGATAVTAAERTSRLSAVFDTVGRAANTFNEIHASITTLSATLDGAVTRVSALASEEANLREMSGRLGLDFDQAASAAGRFADETEAMGVAGRAAASDIRLTQTELDGVMRLAGAKAAELGTTVADAARMLTEALVQGETGGLRRFGAGLAAVAGESHTVQERLAAVVREAGRTAAATDTATDAVNRYKDSLEDAQRIAASSFVTELARLAAVSTASRGAATDADDLKVKMEAVGSTAAYILTQIGNVAGVVAGTIGLALSPILQALDVAVAGLAAITDGPAAAARAMAAASQESRAGSALALMRSSGSGFMDAYRASNNGRTAATPEAVAAAAGGGAGRGSDMTFSGDEATQILGRPRGGSPGTARNTAQELAEARRASSLAFATKQREEAQREAAEEARLAESTSAVIAADLARVRAANDNERGNEAGKGAEQSRLNRLADERTFNGEMRALYAERASLAHTAAEAMKASFDGVGEALSTNIQLFVDGRASLSEALQGVAADSLKAISKQAYGKGAYYAAEALGMLAIGNFPGAGLAAASSAAFFAAGALTGAAGAAIAPTPATAPGGERAASVSPQRATSAAEGGAGAVVNNYYAPVIGGRTATEGESGMQVNRLTAAERRRTDRAA
jgi:hypothetical protein